VKKITITEYNPEFQERIDRMMAGIQEEYAETITTSHSTIISQVYQLPNQKYWVALHGERIAGTIGMVLFPGNNAVVKRMMVDKEFRGTDFKTATLLLDTAFEWAKTHAVKAVYLGTMTQFRAAQRFYEKAGFKQISMNELPVDYPQNPMDTLFYSFTF
jgi:RimJ/RimL family protein N-acetyltransferase